MTAPLLRGRRVVLRAPKPSDVGDRLEAGRDPEFRRMVGAPPSAAPLTRADAERWYQQVSGNPLGWVIEHDGRCIGAVGLRTLEDANHHAKLAIGIFLPGRRGKGLGTEAIRLVLDHAFGTLALRVIGVRVLAFNARAIAVYERCGFRAVRREPVDLDGERSEDIFMELDASDFPSSP